jgi:hypothetical protein
MVSQLAVRKVVKIRLARRTGSLLETSTVRQRDIESAEQELYCGI